MMNKLIIIYELLSICNSRCSHCLREESPCKEFCSSYDSIISTLDKIQALSSLRDIELKLSGGECTIWRDGNKDLSDIICECAKRNLTFAVVSNGKVFQLFENIDRLFGPFLRNFDTKLKLYLTVDLFHGNYEREENKSTVLDNLSRFTVQNSLQNRFDLFVQSTFTKYDDINLPVSFIRKYSSMNYKFNINPLLPLGRGKELDYLVPTLKINENDKNTLGAYKKYNYLLGKKMGLWVDYDEYEKIDNWKAFLSFNCCGKTLMIQNGVVYYCMMYVGNDYFRISTIDDFSIDTLVRFKKNNKICKIWNSDEPEKKSIKESLHASEYPFGYGVCCICKDCFESSENKS